MRDWNEFVVRRKHTVVCERESEGWEWICCERCEGEGKTHNSVCVCVGEGICTRGVKEKKTHSSVWERENVVGEGEEGRSNKHTHWASVTITVLWERKNYATIATWKLRGICVYINEGKFNLWEVHFLIIYLIMNFKTWLSTQFVID